GLAAFWSPPGPWGWGRVKVRLSLRASRAWLPGRAGGREARSRELWAEVHYAGVGPRHTPRRRLPGRVWLALPGRRRWGRGSRAPRVAEGRGWFLAVPPRLPAAALAAVAFEALAAALVARLVGRDAPAGGGVVARG